MPARGKSTKEAATKSANVRASAASDTSNRDPAALDIHVHVRRIGELVGAEIDATPQEMLELGVQDFSRASRLMVRSGWYLLAAKEHFGHGNFLAELEARDIDPRRAQEVMRFAANIQQLPPKEAEHLLTLQPSKAMALANADPEVVSDILSGDTIEDGDFENLSVRQMRAHIKEVEARKANVDEQNAELRAQNAELRDALHNKAAVDHLPAFCLITRHEAAALSEQIIGAVESMEDVYERHLAAASLEGEDAERYRDVALNSVYHAMAAAAARCYSLTDRLRRQWGDRIGGMEELLPFSEDEVERLLAARRVLVSEHQQQAEGRKETRAKQQPKRRGRPRKRLQGDD